MLLKKIMLTLCVCVFTSMFLVGCGNQGNNKNTEQQAADKQARSGDIGQPSPDIGWSFSGPNDNLKSNKKTMEQKAADK